MVNKITDWPEEWDASIKNGTDNIKAYHERVLEVNSKKVPHFFFRFEDLRTNPQQTLEKVFCFLLELESLEGTNAQRRIQQVCNLGHKATVT